jgi:hypothetical protein
MTISKKQLQELKEVLETVGAELHPTKADSFFEEYEQMCEIYQVAFERRPDVFEGLRWINDEGGMPLWVKQGVEWELDQDYDDDDTLPYDEDDD